MTESKRLTKVPEDFAASQENSNANALTAEEVAEFRALRDDKKARDEKAAQAVADAAAELSPPTHYVHLADGSVVQGSSIASHYATASGRLMPVAAVYVLDPQF